MCQVVCHKNMPDRMSETCRNTYRLVRTTWSKYSTLTFAEIGANRYRIHGRNSQTKWSRCIVGFTILNISPYFTDFTVKGFSGIPFRRNYRWNMWNQWTFWGRQTWLARLLNTYILEISNRCFWGPFDLLSFGMTPAIAKAGVDAILCTWAQAAAQLPRFQCPPPGKCSLPLGSWIG